MKRLLFTLFIALCGLSLSAEEIRYMCIEQTNGTVTKLPVSTIARISFVLENDGIDNTTGTHNNYEYVDLGLTSGTLWATCNVGATSPEAYGDYFAWGETIPHQANADGDTIYNWSTYKHCNGSYITLTKYCTNSTYGTVDNQTTLEAADDAVTANWGGTWRMPTRAEQDELCSECTWTWTTLNGVNGYRVTSKEDTSKSIFLPAAGYRDESGLVSAGSYGYYWSSSLRESYPNCAWYLNFLSGRHGTSYSNRYYGYTVRPVCSSVQK